MESYRFPRTSVASGKFIVTKKKKEVLDAYLGSCVGLTICDRHAGVGGLLHLLLPEPVGHSSFGRPETYATTGLPLFLKALYDQGAKKDRMKAYLAGGALVGPLSEQDLNLNIGGRTAEISENILKEEGINIYGSETGGYFSCRMSLNLNSWESDIQPISVPSGNTVVDFKKPTANQLDKVLEDVLPIPQIALKIIQMIRDENESLQDMANEVRQDQVISAKVLKLCNSAFMQMKMEVESIDRALVVLGEKRLLQLVVSAAFEDFISQSGEGYSLCKGGLFNHAIGTAMICEKLAEITGTVPEDVAYTAGLLHDIGKVVLDQYMENAYPLFYRRIQEGGQNLIEVEREVFGIDHTEAGARLADGWSMPEGLGEVIKYHHYPEKATDNIELTHLVYVADLLMSRFLVGHELERINTESLSQRLKKIGLSPEDFPMIIQNIPEQIFSAHSISV
ncbi:HDOD domain-containing protein [Thermodesulfobacteriota bacterium]